MERENERRALLILALGQDAPLLRQLDLTGPVEPFLVNMIKALVDYGKVAPDQQALWALLEVIREHVGVDHQAEIEGLYQVISALGRNDDQGLIFDDKSLTRSEAEYLDEHAFQHILSVLSYFENSKQILLVQRLLIKILSLKDKVKATDHMSKLLPHIQKLPNSLKIYIWQDTLRSCSDGMRENLLEVLPVLQPFMINLGGVGTIEETFRSIQTVSRWWP